MRPAVDPIIVCPKRLYYDDHFVLREIADGAFPSLDVHRLSDGYPSLVRGDQAIAVAEETGVMQVGVFGQSWAGEIKLPQAMPGEARYSVDFTLVVVDGNGSLHGFVPVEVQTIDTTGSYQQSLSALRNGRSIAQPKFGMNWENVNKRILPQLIVKGLMLQGERLCTTGMYFITPEPVFQRIMMRLGSADRLRRIPKQPGSITFFRYSYAAADESHQGEPLPLRRLGNMTISTSDMSLAFISPENLPGAGSFERSIVGKLNRQ